MLETCRIGRVACDGNVDVFLPHDRDAFSDVVCAVAADLASVAVAVGRFFRDLEFACLIVEFRRNVREAVDSGNDLRGVFSETVQDNAQRFFTSLVGVFRDTDRAFRGCEAFVSRE